MAMVIAVGGSKSKKQFDSIRWTMKAYFDALRIKYKYGLFVNNIDEPGAIKKHIKAFDEAYKLGFLLANPDAPLPEKPIDIELI